VDRWKISAAYRVPVNDGRKSIGAAARVRPFHDVREAHPGLAIQPWIEKASRGSTLRNSIVIEERDNACHDLHIAVSGVLGWTSL
jgi:hypothetical protein